MHLPACGVPSYLLTSSYVVVGDSGPLVSFLLPGRMSLLFRRTRGASLFCYSTLAALSELLKLN